MLGSAQRLRGSHSDALRGAMKKVAREVSDLQSYPTMGGVWGFLYLSELTSG
eukprot:SAG22_NODE_3687_length_1578_cov_1.597701_1_plen_51_part_10